MSPAELPLRDIHLPPAPGWWPPAPGWWALLFVALIAAAWLRWMLRRARRRRSAVAQARMELAQLRAATGRSASQIAADVSALLRRVAISLFPRSQVASLTGNHWLAFLDEVQGGDGFRNGPGRMLTQLPYRPAVSTAEIEPLVDLCGAWMDAAELRAERRSR